MDGTAGMWSILTIVGPILLGVAILWAVLRNRGSTAAEDERTEQATRDLYKAEDAAHRGEDDSVA